jgi:hypothetical protein
MDSLLDWVRSHDHLLWWLGSCSLVTFLATLVAIPWLLIRIPEDYFLHRRAERMELLVHQRIWSIVLRVGKNLLGYVFLIAGVLMLVLPGQGILTILMGLALMDFPGKERCLLWLVSRNSVFHSINWIRSRAGRLPIRLA